MSWICYQCSTRYDARVAWCVVCLSAGSIIMEPRRPPSAVAGALQAASARDLVARTWTLVSSAPYPELRLLRGALVALYGPPGAGKSTMLLRLLDGLARPVVLVSAEERLGPAVGERLSRLGVHRADFHVIGQGATDDVIAFTRRARADALGLDSVSATPLQPADLRRLMEAAGVGLLAATVQVTKAGLPAGSNVLLHEADVVIAVEAMAWRVEKSRYQGAGLSGDVDPRAV